MFDASQKAREGGKRQGRIGLQNELCLQVAFKVADQRQALRTLGPQAGSCLHIQLKIDGKLPRASSRVEQKHSTNSHESWIM